MRKFRSRESESVEKSSHNDKKGSITGVWGDQEKEGANITGLVKKEEEGVGGGKQNFPWRRRGSVQLGENNDSQ